jgi:hypothetical protein
MKEITEKELQLRQYALKISITHGKELFPDAKIGGKDLHEIINDAQKIYKIIEDWELNDY